MDRKKQHGLEKDRVAQLLAIIVHELGNPISIVQKATSLLSETPLSEEQEDLLRQASDSANLLVGIMEDLRVWVRGQELAAMLRPQNFRLRQTLQIVQDFAAEQASAKGLEYSFDVEESLPEQLFGDPHRLVQILLNLTDNALKYTDTGGVRVQISGFAEYSSLWMDIQVADTGPGIPLEKQRAIFEPFATEGKSSGMGLGLYVVRELVHVLGGKLWLHSDAGGGSTFEVILPIQLAREEVAEGLSIPADLTFSALIVDDHPLNRLALKQILKAQWPGAEVVEAKNGREAISILRSRGEIDLLLLDLRMPVQDGYDTMKILQSRMKRLRAGMVILAMSAGAQLEKDEKYLRSGFDGHILKPFEPEAIRRDVFAWLKKRTGDA